MFWKTLENGTPFLQPRDRAVHKGDDGAPKDDGPVVDWTPPPPTGTGFWARCTVGGLTLGIVFIVRALLIVPWGTTAQLLQVLLVPGGFVAYAEDDAARAALTAAAYALVRPATYLLAAWWAMRSQWLAMAAAAFCAVFDVFG